ncbi:hypothetical protein ACHAW5_006815 [Stephanodiscus triporus]|uniref:Uncharacterized protein n=1 Tax=Stephanodiscus triporus TaxID=2934178 RepID=A0ABD3PD28_9STRA
MMSTFNATSHDFGDRFNPIICSRKRPQEKGISDSTINDGYYHAHSHQQPPRHASQHSNDVTSGSKRHRQSKEELQYTAATIQKVLADAGMPTMSNTTSDRRERALPLGSVDMDGCKVMTSSEFDDYEDDMNAQADKLNGDQGTRSNAGNCDDYNLASMYMIAGLIQSTRHHYSFSSNDAAATKPANAAGPNSSSRNEALPTKKQSKSMTKEEVHTTILNDKKSSEDHFEVLSSWTPSTSSFNHHNYYDSKSNIDDDNRSDEQSSGMAGGEGGESSSSSYSGSSENEETNHKERSGSIDFDGPYSVIG